MRSGFYLSPDGLHIVEIKKSGEPYFVDIIGLSGIYEDFIFDLCTGDFDLIFSSWELLE